MTTQKPTRRIVRYLVPAWRKGGGGWRHAAVVDSVLDDNGEEILFLKDLGRDGRATKVAASDVQEVVP